MTDALRAEQVRDLKFRRRFEFVKYVFALIGAIYIFYRLTAPEHLFNRSVSEENLAREHARLLLEVLRESDPVDREVSLQIIDKSYPAKDPHWLPAINELLGLLKLRDRYATLEKQNRKFLDDFARARSAWREQAGYEAVLADAINKGYEMQQISDEFERLHIQLPSDDAASLGCVTLDAIDVSPNSATLIGAPLGPRDKEWFDIDVAGKGPMRYSISVVRRAKHEHAAGSKPADMYAEKRTNVVGAVQGTALSLQPGTTYRFRYVAQHDGITCFGDTVTFTTPKKQSVNLR